MKNARLLLAVLGFFGLCTGLSAAVAIFTLDELAAESHHVFVAEVNSVANPNWRDQNGSEVLLADATVVQSLKGQTDSRVVIAYKAGVDDQEQMQPKQRYVVFGFGSNAALLMGHQVLALSIQGDDVLTATIKGEPKTQSLKSFKQRISAALLRGVK